MRVPPGVKGTVIGVKVYAREGTMKDSRSAQIEDNEIAKLRKDEGDKVAIIKASAATKIAAIANSEELAGDIVSRDGEVLAAAGTQLTADFLNNLSMCIGKT